MLRYHWNTSEMWCQLTQASILNSSHNWQRVNCSCSGGNLLDAMVASYTIRQATPEATEPKGSQAKLRCLLYPFYWVNLKHTVRNKGKQKRGPIYGRCLGSTHTCPIGRRQWCGHSSPSQVTCWAAMTFTCMSQVGDSWDQNGWHQWLSSVGLTKLNELTWAVHPE